MPFALNKGVRLHWQERGRGSPIILVMGHRTSSLMAYPVIDRLAARRRVIWFDNRGTGKSGMTLKASFQDFADDTLAVMEAAGVSRAHVFGTSMGGGIALEFGLRHAEHALSVILGCTMIMTPDKPRMSVWLSPVYFLPPFILKILFTPRTINHGYGSAASPQAVAEDLRIAGTDRFSVLGVYAQGRAIANYTLTLEEAATMRVPALVMHGDEDSVVPYAGGVELAQTLPNAELATLDGAGHNYLVASPDKSLAAIEAFLDRIDGSPPIPSTARTTTRSS
jgi:3-oxoadipate enol-lactonase